MCLRELGQKWDKQNLQWPCSVEWAASQSLLTPDPTEASTLSDSVSGLPAFDANVCLVGYYYSVKGRDSVVTAAC